MAKFNSNVMPVLTARPWGCMKYTTRPIYQLYNKARRLLWKQRNYVLCVTSVLFLLIYLIQVWNHRGVVINIVEEHHEALPYWFQAASRGKIGLEGNTLLHIDAHPDDAAPEYFPGYPYFRPPHNEEELSFMMQRNDIFIQAAIMAGFIKRVVHIWPSWSRSVYKQSYTYRRIGLGSATVQGFQEEEVFCECVERAGKYQHCFFMNYTQLALYNLDPETKLNSDLCDIHVVYDFEALNEDTAANLAERGDLVKKEESIILDIDEDFFGVESVFSTMFLHHKLSYSNHVAIMAKISSSIFCPLDIIQEQEIHAFLVSVINVILHEGNWLVPNHCSLSSNTKTKLKSQFVTFMQNNRNYFCTENVKKMRSQWNQFLPFFMNVTREQLEIMKEIGFCLETGPRTLGFFEPDEDVQSFIPCIGRNVPGDTMVALYSPQNKDIQFFSNKLHNILTKLKRFPPKLITIARSMRDGYTPRKHFRQIEQTIIQTVKETWNLHRTHYDQYLLGGEKGWPGSAR